MPDRASLEPCNRMRGSGLPASTWRIVRIVRRGFRNASGFDGAGRNEKEGRPIGAGLRFDRGMLMRCQPLTRQLGETSSGGTVMLSTVRGVGDAGS
jgi:hypothetical protein